MVILAFLLCASAQATISDSRFIPWYQQTHIRNYDSSLFTSSLFFITGDSAYGNEGVKYRGIPELYGLFDQVQVGLAAQAVGKNDPLNPNWKTMNSIEWNVHGKIQGQGFSLNYYQNIGQYISVGMNVNFLHLVSHQKFVLPSKTILDMHISPAQQLDLDAQRRELLQNLGLSDVHWSHKGFSDTFFFIRLGNSSEYMHKCRYISIGTTVGIIAPTSKQRDNKYAASLPMGGEGLVGFLWGLDLQSELKEDWWVGVSLELIKRFSKVQNRRLSVNGEPEIFGAIIGDVEVDPGVTMSFSPFVRFNEIRDGLNFQAQYFYQIHAHDVWTDKRKETSIPINFTNIIKKSHWESEYLLFKLSYDGHGAMHSLPTITFAWDIPLKFLKPEESVKAQKVSLGFEYSF